MCRRRVPTAVIALSALALSTGCLGSDDSGGEPSITDYQAEMNDICARATARLGALPTPPAQISDADFAVEVSRAIRDEAAAAAELRPPSDIRADHLSFVENTEDQATAWADLSAEIAGTGNGATSEDIDALRTDILELSLGRNDLAAEMELDSCRRGG